MSTALVIKSHSSISSSQLGQHIVLSRSFLIRFLPLLNPARNTVALNLSVAPLDHRTPTRFVHKTFCDMHSQ